MQRALILLNPCGREAGRHKLKNGLKTQKMHFLPVFELTLASLTAIWVEQNQCPSHQSFLLTQGPIHEILTEIAFGDFFCFIPMKISHKLCVRIDGTQFLLL